MSPETNGHDKQIVVRSNRSESIANLAAALAKAQGAMEGAAKDAANPFFKSKYADLASCWAAWRPAGPPNELAVIQTPVAVNGGVEIETLLVHSSGEWISNVLWLPVAKDDAQGIGSAITYARRYGFSAITGIAPEDDDGNAAAKSVTDIRAKGMAILTPAAREGIQALESAWKTISPDMRKACQSELPRLKEEASHATSA